MTITFEKECQNFIAISGGPETSPMQFPLWSFVRPRKKSIIIGIGFWWVAKKNNVASCVELLQKPFKELVKHLTFYNSQLFSIGSIFKFISSFEKMLWTQI